MFSHQAGGGLLILQSTGGKADVAGAGGSALDAGAGTRTGVVDVYAGILLLKHLGENRHHVLHGGRTGGVHSAAELHGGGVIGVALRTGAAALILIAAAAAGEQTQGQSKGQAQASKLLHIHHSPLVRFHLSTVQSVSRFACLSIKKPCKMKKPLFVKST